jgi:hypothetical protein
MSENSQKNFLLNWLDKELERISKGWEFLPFAFESHHFETLNKLDAEGNIIDSMNCNIKVDKIEMKVNSDNLFLGVIDYKLSNNSISNNDKIIKEFKSFQMPLYLQLIKQVLSKKGLEVHPYFGMYVIIKPKSQDKEKNNYSFVLVSDTDEFPSDTLPKSKRRSNFLKGITTTDAISLSVDKAFNIRQKIMDGLFPLTEKEIDCRNCDFISLCRRKSIN